MRIERRLGICHVLQGTHFFCQKRSRVMTKGVKTGRAEALLAYVLWFCGIGRLPSVAMSSLGLAHLGRPLRVEPAAGRHPGLCLSTGIGSQGAAD